MTTFGRATPEGVEWDWREDGFTWELYRNNESYPERTVHLHIGPRFPGRPLIGSLQGTEWKQGENGNMEPDCDSIARWWGFPLFRWEVSLMVVDYT